MKQYFKRTYKIAKITDILILLDTLKVHGFKLHEEIEVLEMVQESMIKIYERATEKKKEAKKAKFSVKLFKINEGEKQT